MSPSAKIRKSHHWGSPELWDFLFADLSPADPFYWQQIEEGVTNALKEKEDTQPPGTPKFLEALLTLREQWNLPPVGVTYINLHQSPHLSDPLFLRSEIINCMKEIAAHQRAALIVEGLRQSTKGLYRQWSRTAKIRYAETLALLREVVCRHARKSAEVHLILMDPPRHP